MRIPLLFDCHLTLYTIRRDHSCGTAIFVVHVDDHGVRIDRGIGVQLCLSRDNLFGLRPDDPDVCWKRKLLVVGASLVWRDPKHDEVMRAR